MDQETLSFYNWQFEQEQAERIKDALKRADSGHLIDHAKLKEIAAGWCKIEQSKLDEVVIADHKEARIYWSDGAVNHLQHMCEHMATVWVLHDQPDSRTSDAAESHLKNVLSTVELIASYPGVGRPGLVKETREWGMGFGRATIAYRHLLGEIQVLGVLVSYRKWPRMKSASGSWADRKSLS